MRPLCWPGEQERIVLDGASLSPQGRHLQHGQHTWNALEEQVRRVDQQWSVPCTKDCYLLVNPFLEKGIGEIRS